MNTYRIINQRGTYLSSFHFNGGWEIGDVFPCSKYSWIVFHSEKEVQDYLIKIKNDCIAQQERWGKWTEKALKFVKTLKYEVTND